MESGIISLPDASVRFIIDDKGTVTFPDGLSYAQYKNWPLIVDTIRDNRGFPPIKRVYQGVQAPQWC